MKTKVEEQINIGDMVNNKEFDMTGYVTNIWKKDNEPVIVVQWFHWPSPIPYGKYTIHELVKMKVE